MEESRDNRKNFIESLNCAREAMNHIEDIIITEADLQEAVQFVGSEQEKHVEFLGHKVNRNMLCEVQLIIKSALQRAQENAKELSLDLVKKAFMAHAEGKENKYAIAPNFLASDRVLEDCFVKHFYGLSYSALDQLDDLQGSYLNFLRYSECPEQPNISFLRDQEAINFSMLSYEEAIEEMGRIIDSEEASHGEF